LEVFPFDTAFPVFEFGFQNTGTEYWDWLVSLTPFKGGGMQFHVPWTWNIK